MKQEDLCRPRSVVVDQVYHVTVEQNEREEGEDRPDEAPGEPNLSPPHQEQGAETPHQVARDVVERHPGI